MKSVHQFKAVALAVLAIASGSASAEIMIDTVAVGNVGNTADVYGAGYGAVAYNYLIAKCEVTNTQYTAFLNAVAVTDTYSLYNANMGASVLGGISRSGSSGSYSYVVKSGFENKPVNYVSFWDATRFANWLNNGQGNVDTENGSYTLTGGGISANTVTRNGGANWAVASENEWYKAAYYDPTKNSGAGGYWLHATQSNTLGQNNPFTDVNGANYFNGSTYANGGASGPGTTDVGTYLNAKSFYGTFDQGGNLWEWNEAIANGSNRVIRGGSWGNGGATEIDLRASTRDNYSADSEFADTSFRLVSLAIPEPSTYAMALVGLALALFVMMRHRKVG